MSTFTSNMMKGGAMLEDATRLAEVWRLDLSPEENLGRVSELNLLGKISRARTNDVLLRILKPRFVDPGVHVLQALKTLPARPDAFREACYYETARDDPLLTAFAEGPMCEWYGRGRTTVHVEEVKQWLAGLAECGEAPVWTDNVRTKVARGLLAALRDFGVLEGGTRKRFAMPRLTPSGFAYVAFREHEQGASSRALMESRVWRRWLLDRDRVSELFMGGDAGGHGASVVARAGLARRSAAIRGRAAFEALEGVETSCHK